MHIFIVVLALLASVLLVISVLLQSPKAGSGLTGGIASLGTVQTLGVRRTGDFLSKTTAILAGIVMVLCFVSQFTLPGRQKAAEPDGKVIRQDSPARLPVNNLPKPAQGNGAAPATNPLPSAPAQ